MNATDILWNDQGLYQARYEKTATVLAQACASTRFPRFKVDAGGTSGTHS